MGVPKGMVKTLRHPISVSDSISCRRVFGPNICHSDGGCRASIPYSMLNGGRVEFRVSHFDCNRLFHPRVAPSRPGYWSHILANGADLVVSVLWCQNTFTYTQCSGCYVNNIFMINHLHYDDVTMSKMASEITSVSIVYWNICSNVDQRKRQSSASLAFGGAIHRWPGNYSHKGPVTRKIFPFDDVLMRFRQGPVVPLIGTILLLTCIWNICQRHYTINWNLLHLHYHYVMHKTSIFIGGGMQFVIISPTRLTRLTG